MNALLARYGTVIALGLLLAAGSSAAAESRDHRAERHGHRDRPPVLDIDPGRGGYAGFPEIQVFADPASEHWPANYLPDSHRLDGYDGQPDRITDCRGPSGRTLSTREQPCPTGQKPATPARRWSTSP